MNICIRIEKCVNVNASNIHNVETPFKTQQKQLFFDVENLAPEVFLFLSFTTIMTQASLMYLTALRIGLVQTVTSRGR